jgi:proline iminopeptidase
MIFEEFVLSEGVNIWTARQGEGYSVVLCNGGAGCCDYLEPVASTLDDISQVIRFEQRGCGRSQPASPYNIETCLIDLENIRKHYKLGRFIIGGHSWGADLALIYTLEYPAHVAGLICIAGGRVHNDREWHSEYERRKQQEGEQVPHFDYPPNLEVNKELNRSWKRYIQDPTLLKSISLLMAPALFVYGDKDIRPSWPVEQVSNLMPNARFEFVKGAEHVIWFSHANELRSLIRGFVDDIKGKKDQSPWPGESD